MRFYRFSLAVLTVLAAGSVGMAQQPLGTVFTYQGKLTTVGVAADGQYDFRFKLFDDLNGGVQIGGDVLVENWPVSDGLFTVQLDFGSGAFNGDARFLEISVRADNGEPYTVLSPRQELTAAPHALHALTTPWGGIAGLPAGFADGIDHTGSGFWTASGDDIVNNNSGRVGIGTTGIPQGKVGIITSNMINGLHVENTLSSGFTDSAIVGIGTDSGGRFEATSTSSFAAAVFGTSLNGYGGYFEGRGYFSGDVGIGTELSSPEAPLHVQEGSAGSVTAQSNSIAVFERSGQAFISILTPDSSERGILFGDPESLANGGVIYNSAGNPDGLQFRTGGNAIRMTIRGEGNVGIGTSTPASPLHVQGTDSIMQELSSSHAAGTWMELQNTSTSGRRWALVSTGSANGEGPGKLLVRDITGGATAMVVEPGGNIGIGTSSPSATLDVAGTTRTGVLEVTGADVAEKFPVSDAPGAIRPGMVMEIDPENPGTLRVAQGAYNRRVAGVVSGAGGIPAGTILGSLPGSEGQPAIALSGRVWVFCDANSAAVEVGDLLTTAATPGHAMKVSDHDRARGAIIGKAMSGLEKGRRMVLVLVSLQ